MGRSVLFPLEAVHKKHTYTIRPFAEFVKWYFSFRRTVKVGFPALGKGLLKGDWV